MSNGPLGTFDNAYNCALRESTNEAFDRYLELGPGVVDHLLSIKTGAHHVAPPGGSTQGMSESRGALIGCAAVAYPPEFVAAFLDDRWGEDGAVLRALALTDDSAVRDLLRRSLLQAQEYSARLEAAVGLRRFGDNDSITALRRALNDTEKVVVNQVIISLAAIADIDALPDLITIRDQYVDSFLAAVCSEAIEDILARGSIT